MKQYLFYSERECTSRNYRSCARNGNGKFQSTLQQNTGFDHCPLFKSSVSVNGQSFTSPSSSSSSKTSQNDAARMVFLFFTSTSQNQDHSNSTRTHSDEKEANNKSNDGIHCRYKNQLQKYAEWKNFETPLYLSIAEDQSHGPYRATVVIDGHAFENPQSFSTLDEAENACAEMALSSISTDDFEDDNPSFYKNLLHEDAQKEGISKPQYNTINIGAPHIPTFYSSVEICGEKFYGKAAKCKKAAESNAAKVAYSYIEENGLTAKDYSSCDCDPTEIQKGICELTIADSTGEALTSDHEWVAVSLESANN